MTNILGKLFGAQESRQARSGGEGRKGDETRPVKWVPDPQYACPDGTTQFSPYKACSWRIVYADE